MGMIEPITDARLNDMAKEVVEWVYKDITPKHPRAILESLAAYVARYTDPTPLKECLEKIAKEYDEEWCGDSCNFGTPYMWFQVWIDGEVYLRDKEDMVNITTAGELYKLLDVMGIEK